MYSLLEGIRVLEVTLLAPAILGQHLADLGADVVKVEEPPHGDYVRFAGGQFVGGASLMHLRWNRGKRSMFLDLKSPDGRQRFIDLARDADVVVEGLRAGAVTRFGIDYETVRSVNPKIVYCSLSGTGQFGPYRQLATHGAFYDGYAGAAPPDIKADGTPRIPTGRSAGGGGGIQSAALYGALAVAAGLVHALRTGQGKYIDVSLSDAAVIWRSATMDGEINELDQHTESDVAPSAQLSGESVRYQYYETKDGKYVVFQASERKFWENFCRSINRMDLFESKPGKLFDDHASGDEELRAELTTIFGTRSRAEWIECFIEANVPGGPVYLGTEVIEDPHFKARGNVLEQDHPHSGRVRLLGTPIKLPGETFDVRPAPLAGEHTEEILGASAARIMS